MANRTRKQKHSTYHLSTWVAEFAKTAPADRPEWAAKWLAHLLDDMGTYHTLIPNVLYRQIQPYMLQVREMLWSIPEQSHVFRAPQNWLETETDWLRQYLNAGKPIASDFNKPPSEKVGMIRDMWLQPDIALRRAALIELSRLEKPSSHHVENTFIGLAAWDAAVDSGMDDGAVIAAARISLSLYEAYYSANVGSRHPLMNALNLILARADGGKGLFLSLMPTAEAKAVLIESPQVCTMLLHWVDDCKKFSTQIIHGHNSYSEPLTETIKIDSLATWLPDYASAIQISHQLGIPYRDILEQIIEGFGPKGVDLKLPSLADIGPTP